GDLGMLFGLLQPCRAVGGREHAIAEALQHSDNRAADGGVVLDDQYGLLAGRDLLGRAGPGLPAFAHRPVNRQMDLDGGPEPDLAVDADVTAGLLDETIHHAQPEARALADLLGGEERIERPRQYLRRHSGSGIADHQRDVSSGRDLASLPADGLVE